MKRPSRLKLFVSLLLVSSIACACTLWWARGVRLAEHEAVRALSNSCYIGELNQPVQFGLGPTLAAYYLWQGPQFLEKPMRNMGMPWFDRIVSVQILYPQSINESALPGLDRIPKLTEVIVEEPTKDASYYESVFKEFDPQVTLKIVGASQ